MNAKHVMKSNETANKNNDVDTLYADDPAYQLFKKEYEQHCHESERIA